MDSIMNVNGEAFRHVVGHLASGVTVITCTSDGKPYGMTASSTTSLSLQPPMMLVCINRAVPTATAVVEAGTFVVNILRRGQANIARQFAVPSDDKFADIDWEPGVSGGPVLSASLAHIECAVVETVKGGTHTIFIGEVLTASASDGEPLTYYRGGFGGLEGMRDEDAFLAIRRWVLSGGWGDQHRTAEDVAMTLKLPAAAVLSGLSRLVSEGMMRWEPDSVYLPTASRRAAEEAGEARGAVELGVAEIVIAKATDTQLRILHDRFDDMASHMIGDELDDVERFFEANYAFHETFVALSGNRLLIDAFASLELKELFTWYHAKTKKSSRRFLEVQLEIVESLQARDLDRCHAAIREHTALGKERGRALADRFARQGVAAQTGNIRAGDTS